MMKKKIIIKESRYRSIFGPLYRKFIPRFRIDDSYGNSKFAFSNQENIASFNTIWSRWTFRSIHLDFGLCFDNYC